MYGSYHHILVANRLGAPNEQVYDVVGPICESGDALAKDRLLPKVEEGDLLAVLNAGLMVCYEFTIQLPAESCGGIG